MNEVETRLEIATSSVFICRVKRTHSELVAARGWKLAIEFFMGQDQYFTFTLRHKQKRMKKDLCSSTWSSNEQTGLVPLTVDDHVLYGDCTAPSIRPDCLVVYLAKCRHTMWLNFTANVDTIFENRRALVDRLNGNFLASWKLLGPRTCRTNHANLQLSTISWLLRLHVGLVIVQSNATYSRQNPPSKFVP